MKFVHDFQKDLSALLSELDSGRPFAFNRFWDGELAILEGRDIPTADGWNSVNVTDEFRERLLAALRYRHPDYYVGIGCPCCNRDEWERLMKLAGREPDDPQVTFSTLFVNGNWDKCVDHFIAASHDAILVRPQGNSVNVPNIDIATNIGVLRNQLRDSNRPMYVAAGPATKIIIHTLWSTGSTRQPLIDIGSAFDRSGRGYHDPNHPNRKKICQWV